MQSFAELERHVDRALANLRRSAHPIRCCLASWRRFRSGPSIPPYQREWLTLAPRGLQAASGALLVLVVLGVAIALPLVKAQAADALALVTARAPIEMPYMAASLRATANAVVLVWRAVIQPLIPFALVVAVMAGVASAVIASALNRVLLERSVQR